MSPSTLVRGRMGGNAYYRSISGMFDLEISPP